MQTATEKLASAIANQSIHYQAGYYKGMLQSIEKECPQAVKIIAFHAGWINNELARRKEEK